MYTIPAFGPWPEQNAGPDEEKRLTSAQQSKTSPTSIDQEHETGVFYGSGKLPYQTSLAACTCNDFVKRKKPCKHVYRLAMELGIIPLDYKTGRSSGERNEAQISFEDSIALVEQLSEAAQKHVENMLFLGDLEKLRLHGRRSGIILAADVFLFSDIKAAAHTHYVLLSVNVLLLNKGKTASCPGTSMLAPAPAPGSPAVRYVLLPRGGNTGGSPCTPVTGTAASNQALIKL